MLIKFCTICKKFHDVQFDCSKLTQTKSFYNKANFSQTFKKCNLCNGSGKLFNSQQFYLASAKGIQKCPKCNGKGHV